MMAPSMVQRDEARIRVDSTELEKKVLAYLPELIPAIRIDSWHHDITVHRTVVHIGFCFPCTPILGLLQTGLLEAD